MTVHCTCGVGNERLGMKFCTTTQGINIVHLHIMVYSSYSSGTGEALGGGSIDGSTGVGGQVAISLLRFFQKPTLGPFMMNANVHRDSPLNGSG
jgi:hypothetical protein